MSLAFLQKSKEGSSQKHAITPSGEKQVPEGEKRTKNNNLVNHIVKLGKSTNNYNIDQNSKRKK